MVWADPFINETEKHMFPNNASFFLWITNNAFLETLFIERERERGSYKTNYRW